MKKTMLKYLAYLMKKGLTSSIGHFLGLVDKEYCKSILALSMENAQ